MAGDEHEVVPLGPAVKEETIKGTNGTGGESVPAGPTATEASVARPDAKTDTQLAGDTGAEADVEANSKASVDGAPAQPVPPIEIIRVQHLASGAGGALVGLRAERHPSASSYESILKKLTDHPVRRNYLFVTSVHSREGTTTMAANLAGALARQYDSVLLLELRLTSPRLLHLLGNPGRVTGLEQGLRNKAHFDDCVFLLGDRQLHIMAVKQALSEAEAAQQSGALNDLLGWAEGQFNWVVVDCPPVSTPEWTRWFTLNADPVLLVTLAGSTRMDALEKATELLKDHLAGVILNDLQRW